MKIYTAMFFYWDDRGINPTKTYVPDNMLTFTSKAKASAYISSVMECDGDIDGEVIETELQG